MNPVTYMPSREEPFDPSDMPDFAVLVPIAEWHDETARQLARSSTDLAPFHLEAARCLRQVYAYMRKLRIILADENENLEGGIH
jgi:hypothetical protein